MLTANAGPKGPAFYFGGDAGIDLLAFCYYYLMILSRKAIERAIAEGKLKIEPFLPANFKEASYSFTLQEELTLLPGEFKVVLTKEVITLPMDLCYFVSTRASVANLGIDALQTSTFVEPGSHYPIKLEIKNNGPESVTLKLGTPVVKAVFMRVEE